MAITRFVETRKISSNRNEGRRHLGLAGDFLRRPQAWAGLIGAFTGSRWALGSRTCGLQRIALAAVLGLIVATTGRAEAQGFPPIITYRVANVQFGCDPTTCENLIFEGSFQLDPADIGTSGNTDISSFITNLSFTISFNFLHIIFDPATGFVPEGVTVSPDGSLVAGSMEPGGFSGNGTSPDDPNLGANLSISTNHMNAVGFLLTEGFGGTLSFDGTAAWCNNWPATPVNMSCGPPNSLSVPEPPTWALMLIGFVAFGFARRHALRTAAT